MRGLTAAVGSCRRPAVNTAMPHPAATLLSSVMLHNERERGASRAPFAGCCRRCGGWALVSVVWRAIHAKARLASVCVRFLGGMFCVAIIAVVLLDTEESKGGTGRYPVPPPPPRSDLSERRAPQKFCEAELNIIVWYRPLQIGFSRRPWQGLPSFLRISLRTARPLPHADPRSNIRPPFFRSQPPRSSLKNAKCVGMAPPLGVRKSAPQVM